MITAEEVRARKDDTSYLSLVKEIENLILKAEEDDKYRILVNLPLQDFGDRLYNDLKLAGYEIKDDEASFGFYVSWRK